VSGRELIRINRSTPKNNSTANKIQIGLGFRPHRYNFKILRSSKKIGGVYLLKKESLLSVE
jgi:hypothetical protein